MKLQKILRPGDIYVVWKLDRLGGSLVHLVDFINDLESKGIHFASLSESIDTTTSNGRLFFHMMAALSEFERSLLSERTKAGLETVRARGQRLGRPYALSQEQQALICDELSREIPIKTIASN